MKNKMDEEETITGPGYNPVEPSLANRRETNLRAQCLDMASRHHPGADAVYTIMCAQKFYKFIKEGLPDDVKK